MKRSKLMMAALAGSLILGGAAQSFALNTGRAVARQTNTRAATVEQQEAKRQLRERIRTTQQELKSLERANDPRADLVRRDLQSLKAEWTRLYGSDEEMRGQKRGHEIGKGHQKNKGKGHAKHGH